MPSGCQAPGGCGWETPAGPCPAPGRGPAELPGSKPGSWRGSWWPSPAQRGPARASGNQKVLLEEDEPQQVGDAGACSPPRLRVFPPPPRKAAKPSGGSWDGSRGVSRYELGMKWGDLGCLDTRDPFLALGRPLGLEPSDGACLRVWVSARPEHRPVELQTACGAEHHPTGSPMGPRITPHSILWGQASPHGQPCEAEYHPTSSPMGLNITSRSILWGQASPHKQSGHPTGSVLQP